MATAQPPAHCGQRGLSRQTRLLHGRPTTQWPPSGAGDDALDVIALAVNECRPQTDGSGSAGIGIASASRWSRGADHITESKSPPGPIRHRAMMTPGRNRCRAGGRLGPRSSAG